MSEPSAQPGAPVGGPRPVRRTDGRLGGGDGALALRWLARNAMPIVACVAALASMIVVPPDRDYLEYFDTRTLVLLAALLAVISSLRRAGVFALVSGRGGPRTVRGVTVVLVIATAAFSALFTNDVALLVLLPLAAALLSNSGRSLAIVFVLMAGAANLGGMLTPFGSPQNLFLFSRFEFGAGEFLGVMVAPFAVSMTLLLVLCFLVPAGPVRAEDPAQVASGVRMAGSKAGRELRLGSRGWIALALFAGLALIVLRAVPLWAVGLVALVLIASDRDALRKLDWGLLLTFIAFFVFAGNLARVPGVESLIGQLLGGGEVLAAALFSQVISNVPAAILLAPFSSDPAALLVGVNIGGVGTLVASLASLIALNEFRRARPGESWRFVLIFTGINALLLGVLLVVFAPSY